MDFGRAILGFSSKIAEQKLEWHDGRVYAMAGGGYVHSRIIENLSAALKNRLNGTKCSASGSNFHVQVEKTGTNLLPDNAIHCGKPRFAGSKQLALLNPVAIFEVLSPSTEKYDQNGKFELYEQIESLQDYVLIAQEIVRVLHYTRRESGWLLQRLTTPDAILHLALAGVEIPLSDLYDELDIPVQLTLLESPGEEL